MKKLSLQFGLCSIHLSAFPESRRFHLDSFLFGVFVDVATPSNKVKNDDLDNEFPFSYSPFCKLPKSIMIFR